MNAERGAHGRTIERLVGRDDRGDELSPVVVGDAEHDGTRDTGDRGESALDLRGIDVEAARDDRVVLAIDERQVARIVDRAEIADRDVTIARVEGRELATVVRQVA